MNKQISFFIKNRNFIESLRTEQEIIDFFAENNIFIDENFIKTIKFNSIINVNNIKLTDSQLEKISGGSGQSKGQKRLIRNWESEGNPDGKKVNSFNTDFISPHYPNGCLPGTYTHITSYPQSGLPTSKETQDFRPLSPQSSQFILEQIQQNNIDKKGI